MGFCPPVNCTGSDQPHDHVETEAESSSGESVRGVPMMKLEPAVDFVPMLKVEKLAHAVGDDVKVGSYMSVCPHLYVRLFRMPRYLLACRSVC